MSTPQRESDYDVVDDVTTGMRFRLIIAPGGGVGGTGSVEASSFANGTLIAQAVEAWLTNNLLGGNGLTVDTSIDGQITLNVTAGGTSYTDEQVRDVVAAALNGGAGRVLITFDDPGNTITVDLDPAVLARLTALEAARSEVQSKENTATGGGATNTMVFPAGANYIDAPSAAIMNQTGNIGFALRVLVPAAAVDWCMISRRGTTAATTQLSVFIDVTGQLHATTSVNGTSTNASTTTVATPLPFNGQWLWLRVTREQSTGQWDFYTAPDTGSNNVLPTSWTTFQLNRGSSLGSLWNPGNVPFEINGYAAGTQVTAASSVGRVIWYTNETLTGTPILDANASDYVSGTSWTGPAGNTFTLHGSATITLAGGGATTGTAPFIIGDTDANPAVALFHRDVIYFWDQGGVINTSGGGANTTWEVLINGVVLTAIGPPALPNAAAGTVYRYEFSMTIEMSSTNGTTQIYAWTLRIYDAIGGSFVGSQFSSAILHDRGGGWAGALTTFTTLPAIALRMTMTPSSAGISAGHTNSRVALQRA